MQLVILGVDCSSKQSSVCMMQDGRVIYTAVQATNTTHSRNFLPMVEAALTVCGYTPKDVDLYAVTLGPGSFTGLRIGLAVIKGMAAANNTPCIGVSSLKAMAKSVDLNGIIVPSFDARRRQVYACVMDGDNVICDDFCRDVSVLEKYITETEKDVYFIGDGKQCEDKETVVFGLVTHIRDALLGKHVILPVVIQYIFAESRLTLAFVKSRCKRAVKCFDLFVAVIDGYNHWDTSKYFWLYIRWKNVICTKY